MIFRQLFDAESSSYCYLLGDESSRECLLIDPVIGKVDRYLSLIAELGLALRLVADTHVHADHITGAGLLRDATSCITAIGREAEVDRVSMRFCDGEVLGVDGLELRTIHTPGHTNCSYCFAMADRVFTGDTLLIRGTGRTDFQAGDPYAAYQSITQKLLTLPNDTWVYPGHDYKGDTVSTIGEERAFNPRLQVNSSADYAAVMNALNLPDPKAMDVAVPANLTIGASLDVSDLAQQTINAETAIALLEVGDSLFVDLREPSERQRDGIIPSSVHAPYRSLDEALKAGGVLEALAQVYAPRMVLYCAFGERSALALRKLQAAGFDSVRHLGGGLDAWIASGGTIQEMPSSAPK